MLTSAASACAALMVATASTSAPAPPLEPAPTIELVTLAPGEALYTLWGHAAIRVVHARPRRDLAYNFGSIDFSGAFMARMLAGEVDAFVGVQGYHEMARIYRDEQRSIVRRTLQLEADEARALAAWLERRTSGPRVPYRYHHFDDNCSTQVADAIDRALDGQLSEAHQERSKKTLRAMALEPIRKHATLYVVIDTLFTGVVDRPLTKWQARFLPATFADLLDQTELSDGRPIVSHTLVEYRGADAQQRGTWTWPWVKVYLLVMMPLLFLAVRFPRAASVFWTALAGIIGVLLAVAWLGTGFDFLHHNWNLLVFPPTHLLLFFVLLRSQTLKRRAARTAIRIYGAVHLLVLIGLTAGLISGAIGQAIGPMLGLALGPALALAARPYGHNGDRRPHTRAHLSAS